MEEEPLNELFVLKQNENVEIDCLQAYVTLCASITQLSLSYQQQH